MPLFKLICPEIDMEMKHNMCELSKRLADALETKPLLPDMFNQFVRLKVRAGEPCLLLVKWAGCRSWPATTTRSRRSSSPRQTPSAARPTFTTCVRRPRCSSTSASARSRCWWTAPSCSCSSTRTAAPCCSSAASSTPPPPTTQTGDRLPPFITCNGAFRDLAFIIRYYYIYYTHASCICICLVTLNISAIIVLLFIKY